MAKERYRLVIKMDPDHVEGLAQLAVLCAADREYEEAEALSIRYEVLCPDDIARATNRANFLYQAEKYNDAARLIHGILSRMGAFPTHAALHVAGLVEYSRGNLELAQEFYVRCMALEPNNHGIKCDLGMLQLAAGNLQEGWVNFEGRWAQLAAHPVMDSGIPLWRGQNIAGKRILVYGEQGFGDMLQFVRFLRILRERGAHVIYLAVQPLVRLFQMSNVADEVVCQDDGIPSAHYRVSLGTLPAMLNIDTVQKIDNKPYLKAGLHLQLPKGGASNTLKVGLVWAGRPGLHPDYARSMKLEMLLPLLDVKGCTFYSLQKGEREAELKATPEASKIIDCAPLLNDFADTGALIKQLDLVISVDTSTMHVSAGMGRPTWLLVPVVRCWRWLRNRDNSPWYRGVKIFQQKQAKDWVEVIERVKAELIELASVKGAK